MSEKKQILFVDDDEFILLCYTRLLGKRFSMETALGPIKAIEALEKEEFAVVAADMRMPEMNGIDLLRRVNEKSPATVGILMSGNTEQEEIRNHGSTEAIFKLVSKPCPTADLIQIIEEALELHRNNSLGEFR